MVHEPLVKSILHFDMQIRADCCDGRSVCDRDGFAPIYHIMSKGWVTHQFSARHLQK